MLNRNICKYKTFRCGARARQFRPKCPGPSSLSTRARPPSKSPSTPMNSHQRLSPMRSSRGSRPPPVTLKYTKGSQTHKEELKEKVDTPQDAFKFLLNRCFSDTELSDVASSDDLSYICHRVVHGGDYPEAVEINDATFHHLKGIEDLAPL